MVKNVAYHTHLLRNWAHGYLFIDLSFGPSTLQRLKQAFQKQIQQVQLMALQVHYDRLDTSHPMDKLSV